MKTAVKLVVMLMSMQSLGVYALQCYEYYEAECIDDGSNALISMMCAFVEVANQNSTLQKCTVQEPGSCMKVSTSMTVSGITMKQSHASCHSGTVADKCYTEDEMEDVFSDVDMGDMPSNADIQELDICLCTSDLCNTGSALTISWVTVVNSLLLAATALYVTNQP